LLNFNEITKKEIDQWAFVTFCVLFFILQLVLLIWFIVAQRHVRQLKKEEKNFLRNFSSHQESKDNFKLNMKTYGNRASITNDIKF
jgi:hypothetical protein